MRTTITIDDDLLEAAKALAAQRKTSVGSVVSDLMRKGLRAAGKVCKGKGGFPVFEVPENARPVTLETVKLAEEEAS